MARVSRESRTTIRDVARAAGVSAGTASVALNGPGNGTSRIVVSGATRERVMLAARELSYRPNGVARALGGRSRLVGVMVHRPSRQRPDHFIQQYVLGLQQELNGLGYQMLLGAGGTDLGTIEAWLEDCRSYCAAGAVLVASGEVEHQLRRTGWGASTPDTLGRDMPCVVIGADVGPAAPMAVCIDHRGAARAAVSHLLSLGHRRFLLLGVGHSERLAGCHAALAAAGLDPARAISQWSCADPAPHFGPACTQQEPPLPAAAPAEDWAFQLGRWVVRQEYDGGRAGPTAIVANNDEYAAGALAGLRERGLRVPQDVAIVGCDNAPFGAYLDVPLTTVDYRVPQIARRGAAALVAAIEQTRAGRGVEHRRETVPAALVVRHSCGAGSGGGDRKSATEGGEA